MNLFPTLSKLYKEGSVQGQCFAFMHKLVEQDEKFPGMPVSFDAKYRELKRSGILINNLDSIKVGDVLLLKYGYFGHGALVNNIIGSNLQLSESNYQEIKKPLRCSHSRQISVHDPAIMGVWIGTPLYKLPEINYPIQLRVMILQNNQPFWNSLLQHMANLQNWFWQASGQKVELIIDYKNTNLTNWETVFTGPNIGGLNVEVIKESWYDQNIIPLSQDADIVIFNMPRKDWRGTVFDQPNSIELGYCYEKVGMRFPIKIMTVSDEHDDYAPYYPTLGAFAKLVAHEICHGLYGVAGGPNIVPGGDYTHNHFFGQNGYAMKPEDCFNDYDYSKLI